MPIKTIIFDLGGVIINLDYNRTIEAFRKLGAVNIDKIYQPPRQSALFDEFELGHITPEAFRTSVKKELEIEYVSDEEFDQAWNAMLLDIPRERLELVEKLRGEGYNVFLFSNTNKIHYDALLKICQRDLDRHLDAYFDNAYYSFVLRKMKPDVAAFGEILARHSHVLHAEETLFIDDSEVHIQGAQQAGLWTFYLTKDRRLLDMLIRLDELEEHTAEQKEKTGCECSLL